MKQFFLNRADVHQFQDPSNVMNFIDVDQSKGNYITDSDGNHMLDLCSGEYLPLGHNHHAFVSQIDNKDLDHHMLNLGLDASILSSPESVQLTNEVMSQIAPYGMKHATLTNGSSAVEEAIQAALS
jgi:4-aminobutyrate aminotransferase-like enzyme